MAEKPRLDAVCPPEVPPAQVRILTPLAAGAIAVIQVSGRLAPSIAETVFRPRSGRSLREYGPCRLVYGDLLDGQDVLDDGLAVQGGPPEAPWVEFNVHGGVRIVQRLSRRLTQLGAEVASDAQSLCADANPLGSEAKGRVQRASGSAAQNGVAAAVRHEEAHLPHFLEAAGRKADRAFDWLDPIDRLLQKYLPEAATGQVVRWLVQQADLWRRTLADWAKRLEMPESALLTLAAGGSCQKRTEIGSARAMRTGAGAARVSAEVEEILARADLGSAWRGRSLAVIGPANVGKSTIANRLAGQAVSLVADQPGTTRDWVGQWIALAGWPVFLMDTAGLRTTADAAEAEGVARAIGKAREADLRLFVVDRSCLPTGSETLFIDESGLKSGDVVALAKADLPSGSAWEQWSLRLPAAVRAVSVSARTGHGWADMERALAAGFGFKTLQEPKPLLFCAELYMSAVQLVSTLKNAKPTR